MSEVKNDNVLELMIDKPVVDELQRADIEQSSRREIIVSCIERGVSKDSQSFQMYQQEYQDWYLRFMELKSAIEAKFVLPNNTPERSAASWNLNYNSCTLTIIY